MDSNVTLVAVKGSDLKQLTSTILTISNTCHLKKLIRLTLKPNATNKGAIDSVKCFAKVSINVITCLRELMHRMCCVNDDKLYTLS